jgi:Xaa-Pro aminopeptidase
MGIGDWGLGIGDWAQSPIPNPQSPIPILWTDSRYYLQAEKELNKEWQMIPLENSESDLKNFIVKNLDQNTKIALNYRNFSVTGLNLIREFLKCKNHNVIIVNDDTNVDNQIILKEVSLQDSSNLKSVFVHDEKYCGMSTLEKFKLISENFDKFYFQKIESSKTSNNYAIIFNKLDEIAWLSNLRGSDIPHNPVFFSYAILYLNKDSENVYLDLYLNTEITSSKNILSDIPSEYFSENRINLKSLENFYSDLENFKLGEDKETKILLDKNSANYLIFEKISSTGLKYYLLESNIVEHLKSLKNDTELEGIRKSHIRDGAAIVRYLSWLENQLLVKNNKVTELEGAEKLNNLRKENELFIEESFDTISSSGDNSAVIHYKSEKNTCKFINPNEIYLLDSGGQYLDGTTDTTRTVHFTSPTDYEKEMYTRILLGNLSIEKLLLNKNKKLTGANIDSIARQYLWQVGEDYGHGTGHGIGHFLNVHEGPQSISPRSTIPLQHGMVTSNEPGFYLKGNFGIRIENVLLTLQHHSKF